MDGLIGYGGRVSRHLAWTGGWQITAEFLRAFDDLILQWYI
jgi:hypothetical protein